MTTGTGMEDLTRIQLEDIALWLRGGFPAMYADALSYARSRAPAPPLADAAHCPICGGKLDPVTLQHITRSGARIPAAVA